MMQKKVKVYPFAIVWVVNFIAFCFFLNILCSFYFDVGKLVSFSPFICAIFSLIGTFLYLTKIGLKFSRKSIVYRNEWLSISFLIPAYAFVIILSVNSNWQARGYSFLQNEKTTFICTPNDVPNYSALPYTDSSVLLIDKTEVTIGRYLQFCKRFHLLRPYDLKAPNLTDPQKPVTGVSFLNAQLFSKHRGMRLLKYSDWMKLIQLCPNKMGYWWGDSAFTDEYAVYCKSGGPQKVASKKPTILGLFDIFGNVDEMLSPDSISESGYYSAGGSFCGIMKWLEVNQIPRKESAKSIDGCLGFRCAVEYPKKEWERISN